MEEVIIDTLLDTARLLPFLYITYLIMGILEKRASGTMKNIVRKSGKAGPVIGGILGVVPQCGFSAAASGFYAGRMITLGTLIAIYLSTSDEMLPILISESSIGMSTIVKILLLKVGIGMVAGIIIDIVFKSTVNEPQMMLVQTSEQMRGMGNTGRMQSARGQATKMQTGKMQTGKMQAGRMQGSNRMPDNAICTNVNCICGNGKNVFFAAFIHTFRIAVFILIISFVMNLVIFLVGEDSIKHIFLNKPVIGELLAALVGLIPNCAASVVLTQLYVEGALSFGACMAGLLVGAGVGILVLFRANRRMKENIRVVALLYCIGVISGIILEFLPAGIWR